MATPIVRWNEASGRWMAWVRFPDGTRKKVERVDKAAAHRDLDDLIELRSSGDEAAPRRERPASFGEVLDAWIAAGCPTVSPTRKTRHARAKWPNTIANVKNVEDACRWPGSGLPNDETSELRAVLAQNIVEEAVELVVLRLVDSRSEGLDLRIVEYLESDWAAVRLRHCPAEHLAGRFR
jgi:hypothetical protein